MALINVALYCSKADIKVPVVGGVVGGGANRFSCQTHSQEKKAQKSPQNASWTFNLGTMSIFPDPLPML